MRRQNELHVVPTLCLPTTRQSDLGPHSAATAADKGLQGLQLGSARTSSVLDLTLTPTLTLTLT